MSPTKTAEQRDPQGRALVAASWTASRLLILTIILVTVNTTDATFADAVSRWDVQHFMQIAQNGYVDPKDVAFFPGLPLLLRAFQLLGIPLWLAGLSISLVSSALATAALYRLYGTAAACLWTIAPMTVFTFVPYTEAPFCAAAFWAWERARNDRWSQAGLLTAIACSLRISGLFLVAGLGILALTRSAREMADDVEADKPFMARIRDAAWLLLPAAVIVGYVVFLHGQTGSWRAWFDAQSAGWQRSLGWPWEGFQGTWPMTKDANWPGRPEVAPMFRLELCAAVIGYLGLVVALLQRRWGEMTWLAANLVGLTFSTWFISVTRGVLIWFPIYRMLGDALAWRPANKTARQVVRLGWLVLLAADLCLLGWWTYTFARGGWAS